MNPYIIVTFYKFISLPDYQDLKELLLEKMVFFKVKGTIILASEGINGSFCGTREEIDNYIAYLRLFAPFSDINFRESYNDFNPFDKSKVKKRKEIVSMGVDGIDSEKNTGIHLKPAEWNALITDDNVVVIDTRNDYEFALGTFKNAINPRTINFRDFPDYVENHLINEKDKKIAMFCTGGVRCEKSTAYLRQLGFEHVYQLDGGILQYLEATPAEESLWNGSCFVFDNRVALDEKLAPLPTGSIDLEWKNKHKDKPADSSRL